MPKVEDESSRRFSVLAHASALLGLIIPLGQLLGPYLASLLVPPHAERARQEATEALNFQLNMVVLVVLLVAVLTWLRAGWWFFILFVPNLYAFGMAVWGATKASQGQTVRYPFVLRLVPASKPQPPRSAA